MGRCMLMVGTANCPERDCWQALLAGTLPLDEEERWTRHLDSCQSCLASCRTCIPRSNCEVSR